MPHKIPFRVVHVSGQDENFKAIELNSHNPTVRGWHSTRFCLYPQDIVVYLEQKCRIRKIQILAHQFLIPTKIEFFVGDVQDGAPHSLQNARYTRLGYVCFCDNEKTGFRARELKSVHVDAVGVYMKLVVHKNFINRHNLYNQVGVVAINVIGDEITNPFELNHDAPVYDTSAQPGKEDLLSGKPLRADFLSPMEDLAFDMYQDPEIASLCRKLDRKKQDAVLQERYDHARRLRDAILRLTKEGEVLARLEVEKRQAIECENYELAKLKKLQIDERRMVIYRELGIGGLLEDSGPLTSRKNQLPWNQIPRIPESSTRLTPPPPHTPLPPVPHSPAPISRRSPPLSRPPDSHRSDPEEFEEPPPPRQRTPYVDPEERPLPALRNPQQPPPSQPQPEDDVGPLTGEAETMSERDQREAASAIEVFGLPLVSKAYSKTWSHREDATLEIHKRLQRGDFEDKDEVKAYFRATVFLVQRGMKDKVYAVLNAVVDLNKYLFTEFVDAHSIPKPDVHYAVDKIVPPLNHRVGETAVRIRDLARHTIIEMSHWSQVNQFQSFYTENTRPFKPAIDSRLALGKVEIVTDLFHDKGLSGTHHGLTMDNTMLFLVAALQHKVGSVREAAEKLIVDLYRTQDKNAVRSYLPPDTPKERKSPLYRALFEAFDKVDGKPSKQELARRQKEDEAAKNAAKQKEIEELQAQLQELRNMTGGGPKQTPRQKAPPPENKKAAEKPKEKPQAPPPETDEPLLQLENTCIFCSEQSEDFTEEGLDMHYWKKCPMLRRCANCKQVVEIATLTEHLLSECEAKDNFSQCPRCTEAIPKAEFDQHVKEQLCSPAQEPLAHCPLCHINFSADEKGWKEHLMGANGCAQNPRRLAALGNQSNKGKPAGSHPGRRSNIPKSTGRAGGK